MQFLTLAALFAAAAVAAPAAQVAAPLSIACTNTQGCPTPYEALVITDYLLRKNNGVQSVSFKLSSGNTTELPCRMGPSPVPSKENAICGEFGTSPYNFALIKSPSGRNDPGLAIYHQTGPAVGKWGVGEIPTHCRAGGSGPADYICTELAPMTFFLW